jgi:hypothetical protein
MTTGSLSASYALPANLPAGAYSMQWELTPVEGDTTHKETSLNIAGYRVRFQNASLENKIDRNGYSSVVRFRIHADQNISANIKLKLRGPDGTIIPVSEGPVSLSEGMQEIPFTFAFKAETAGIWELHYSIEAPLPQLPGFTQGPVVIAAGYSLFDIGETALLGVTATKPVYYKSSGPVELSAYLFGSGSAKIEFFLDKRKFRQERIDLSGADTFIVSIPDLIPGTHTVQAIVTGKELASAAEYALIYGAHIPDLVAGIETSCPAGLVMPVSISITNQGKLATSPCKAALYEDDPAHGGSLLSSVDVPSLGPDATHHAVVKWPLLNKSGKRKLFIIVDAENVIMESNKTNNTAMSEVTIPDLLLFATPLKNAFSADEAITFNLFAANLSTTVYKDLNIKVAFTDPAGNGLFYETVPLTEFVPGAVKNIDRSITLASLPTGTYKLGAQLANTAPLASVSSDIYVIPTLSLRGSFEGTPDSAALCMPFTLQYSIKNTGNLPVSTGALKLEIRSLDTDQLLYARQLPLTLDAKSLLIDKMDFPKGVYRITLKASVINQITRITRELDLADKKLHVVSPIIVNKSETAIPRVLLLLGNYDVSVQRAVAEKIVKESFEEGGVYYAIVDTVADFTARAKSGIFNTYVLLENNELLERADWLSEKVNSGQGLVIIGPDNKTMLTAEAFGFTFSETPAPGGAMLLFTEDSGLGLSGTMPISGPMLLPRRNGAQPAALFVGDKKAAALIDMSGKGRVMVMPFSLTHSALDTGATSLYSLLLRTAVRNVVPKTDEQTVISVQELEVSSTDPINTRIVVTVPGESGIIWTNAGGSVHNNTVSYELIANQEAQKLIFMYKYAESGKKQPVVDVSYECGGKFVVQGNVE